MSPSAEDSSAESPAEPKKIPRIREVQLYTDGACSGNPGPGGWAFILRDLKTQQELTGAGGERDSTNNRMELTAVLEGLRAAPEGSEIELVTDSTYVAHALSKGWLDGWQRRGWRTASKDPVANQELWKRMLVELARHRRVTPTVVKGHAGHPENEECDQMAVEAAREAAMGWD